MMISLDVLRKKIANERALFKQAMCARGVEALIVPAAYTVIIDGAEMLRSPEWILAHINDRIFRGVFSESELDELRLAVWANEIAELEMLLNEELAKRKHS